ncbi:hypothetical protein IFM89_036390 [Coptis chinensis]|uniref:Uncharacterized protein n=1 Tax=Coptis chinensis TaxID=261450 RepID=A0A835IHT2_9MAGN|nr:hypothetical protein IFM89_036390 [Coptis chinensis]
MGSVQTLVCVKQVKQDVPEEWDETMPLPGDIIEGVAEDEGEELFMPTKVRSELSSQLGKLNRQVDSVWVKVRRGDTTLKLQAIVVQERGSKLQRRYTISAVDDDRHVAVLGDCTLDQCTELQEKSRTVVNVSEKGFRKKGVKYDWKKKVGTYLPDQRSTVVSSILFLPLPGEHTIGSTTSRSMAWFAAAGSSGAPLIFVNIQTEQVITSKRSNSVGREMTWGRQQTFNTTINIVQGVRLWFLPGVLEIPIMLTPEPGESRFGMDIKRTEELQEQASETGHLVMISRLEGKSLMPSMVSSSGLIHCCDSIEVKDTLASAIEKMDCISLHIMAWADHKVPPHVPRDVGVATLRPPNDSSSPPHP